MNMASAAAKISLTGGPLKTVLFTATLLAGVGAARLNIRNLLVRTFTGSGSYSRIIATILVLANLKNVPFAWHVRLPSPILPSKLIVTVPRLQFDPQTLPLLHT